MAELGANTLRTFTIPPRWLLDLAGDHNLRVLAGIPWAEHVCFLDWKELTQGIRRTVSEAVKACGGASGRGGVSRRERDPAGHRSLVRRATGQRFPA